MSRDNGDGLVAVSEDMSVGQRIGARMVQARNKRGIKQKEFADLAQVSVRTIHAWETGETIPWRRMDELAAILEVEKDWLINGERDDATTEMMELIEKFVRSQRDLIDQVKLLRMELQDQSRIPF